MLGIGIDILSLARLEGLIARRGATALARRICSPREVREFASVPFELQSKYLSSRWCLKEAAYKSLSTHLLPRWSGFDIITSPHTSPIITMTELAVFKEGSRLVKGDVELMASLSNDAGLVVAVIIAMKKG